MVIGPIAITRLENIMQHLSLLHLRFYGFFLGLSCVHVAFMHWSSQARKLRTGMKKSEIARREYRGCNVAVTNEDNRPLCHVQIILNKLGLALEYKVMSHRDIAASGDELRAIVQLPAQIV